MDVAYMDINRKWPVNSENNENIPEFSIIPKIPVCFRTGVSNLIFGKIFGNFREIFGHSKPLFYFGPVSDFDNFWLSAIGNCRKSKISAKRMALIQISINFLKELCFKELYKMV